MSRRLALLTVLGVTRSYIAALAERGYKPQSLDALVQLKALDISPEFVRAVRRDQSLPPVSDLVKLKAFQGMH